MVRTRLLPWGFVAAFALCWAASCSDDVPLERSDAECSDKKDNDGDGLIDCADPDCRARPSCAISDGAVDGPKPDMSGDGSGVDQPGAPDAGPEGSAGDSFSTITETEPNGGTPATAINAITVPTVITGAIGAANDADVFSFAAQAGDRLTVSAKSDGDVQLHLAVFGDASLDVPAAVNAFGHGNDALAEYYVLESGTYYIAVRDRRNVGNTPAGVGGPSFGYTITVQPLVRAPIALTLGSALASSIAPAGTVRVFAFDALKDDDLELFARAAALTPASDVDTRLSLFFPAQGSWHGTNDNPSLSESDSHLTGKMPFTGTYHMIVEDVADSGSDLRVEVEVRKKP